MTATSFKALLLEGLFYKRDGSLYVEHDGGTHTPLDEAMAPLADQRVQFAVHHLPPNGIQAGEPGAGSCKFPGGRGCPVGHDRYPDRLLAFHLDGVLRRGPWRIEKFDGSVVAVPFLGMDGHYGRVAGATIVDVEAMREAMAGLDPAAFTSSGLGSADLEQILTRLRRTMTS